jgi:regulator of nucleoside diphosphate kinase
MPDREIFVTETDRDRLDQLLDGLRRSGSRDREHLADLEAELERAHLVPSTEIPPDVVTMNSEVVVRDVDSGDEMMFTLVFPSQADADRKRMSVLAPIGTAVLGYRAGDSVEWPVPGGVRHLKIERVLYQPEAAHDYDR